MCPQRLVPQRLVPQRLIIVGNGMVAGRLMETLLERAPGAWDITVFNAEPRVNYDRIQLSPVLAGEKAWRDIVIHDDDWYARNGISLHRGVRVADIDRAARTVSAADGTVAPYDRLVLATGSTPILLPLPGADLPGVVSYRDLDDVEAMLAAARRGGRAVVIGGGLLGLEAAAGLKARGMEVTVLHLMPSLMERQLDPAAGWLLEQALVARGITVLTRADSAAILGEDRVEGIALKDGRVLPADLIVMAVGIRPASGLARAAGLAVGRGVQVDDHMVTSDPAILAVGECVEHRGQCYGLVAPLYEMAKTAAAVLAGDEAAAWTGAVLSTRLKVTGIDLFSAGDFAEGRDREEIVLRDAARAVYRRLVLKDDRIVGAVLYGDTSDSGWYFQLMKEGRLIDAALRDTLVFGEAYAGGPAADPTAAVAALPDEAEICGCNGVCKGRITAAIAEGAATVADIRAATRASASCGSCTGLVERLLQRHLGDLFVRPATEPICRCTDLGHDEVRRLILARGLTSIPAVMQTLEWKTSCGCHKCRPALNYYLLCAWPGVYVDDAQSRFVNERMHANIQKDGTFSVVPRMWGGMTSAAELRAIADVVDRFAIPAVKVTGGQRIDLLGVRKEDLPAVWADLNAAGLVSGHAYGKALRTVKTCVGTDWCRFGTQDSTGLGIRLERFLWGSWTPHKVKLAVSGCPRNCAEATCKDFGVVCVDSGYELHFAGAAGMHVRPTELLCKVETEEEVLEYCGALMQLYREEARYLERIYAWAGRVGIGHVRSALVADAGRRRALLARFVRAQEGAQEDPWAARVSGPAAEPYRPLAPALEVA